MTFQGAVADVFAFRPRQGGQHGEHHAGRIMASLQLAGEELQGDACGAQLCGEFGQGQAAAKSLVLVDDQGDGDAGGAHLAGQVHGPLEFGPPRGAGGDLLRKEIRLAPAALRESSWVSGDCRSVEARA
ncbi:hypothetical protein ABGB14_37005 [Nonomuraea sp. B10E15]|uniref:hypothetical protein n=1 Tax=Nonomuraea sp. B10E15 TaxID=3153560 RepID=UPI00325DF7A7